MKLDMTSPIEERIRQINQIDSIAVLEALLRQMPASDDTDIMKEWETTKALIRGRIAQISEHEKVTVESSHDDSDSIDNSIPKRRKKKSAAHILSIIAFVLSSAYFLLLAYAISENVGEAASMANTLYGDAYAAGVAIGIGLMVPHMVVIFVGYVFNIVSMFVRRPWSYLVAAILYSVSAVLLITYSIGVVVQIVLMFVAFGLSMSAKRQ